jgi:hypothetical protein
MKKLIFLIVVVHFGLFAVNAQSPQAIKYQSIVRDKKGDPQKNKKVNFRISILRGSMTGTASYVESDTITTSSFGLVNLELGKGKKVSGGFDTIQWGLNPYFIKLEVDISGGSSFTFMGTSQLMSVPYAFFANYSGTSLTDKDTSPTNEIQLLGFSNDTLRLSKGGFVYLGNYNNNPAILALLNKVKNDSTFLQGLITTGAANQNTELTNRTNADNTLQTNITTETNARIAGDNGIKTKAVSDSNYLKGLITTETINRTNSDNTLQTNLNILRTKEVSDSLMFAGYLNTINTNLTTETNNRTNADNTLQSNITAETIVRITADNGLRSKVVSDSSFLKGLLNTNTTNLNTEVTNRTNADNTLQSNITTETNSRITVDNNLKSKQVSDSTYIKGLINTNTTNISTETTNRTNADNTLQTNITAEANARIDGDKGIKNKAVSDSTVLRGQINTTNTNLTAETNSRITIDNGLKTKIISDSTYLNGLINNKDGSETKVTAGNSINVSGTGITTNPYLINYAPTHYIGEFYGGGIVFYVNGTGNHGLICSLLDLSTSQVWSNLSTTLIGPTAQSDWDGPSNDAAIIGQSGHTTSAALLCENYVNANYNTGVYSDWFLPTIQQVNKLYNAVYELNKQLDNDGNSSTTALTKAVYWSSTEARNNSAYCFLFYFGYAYDGIGKSSGSSVRAVRSF